MAAADSSRSRAPSIPVAHVHWAMPPTLGGVESHLAAFTEVLAAQGHPVTVYTGTRDATPIPGVEIVQHDLLNLDSYLGDGAGALEERRVAELAAFFQGQVRSHGFAVIHGHNLHYFSAVPARALNRTAARYPVRLHNTYHSVWPNAVAIARHCRRWPGQHAWSRHVADFCAGHLGVPVCQRYPGVRLDSYRGAAACGGGGRPAVILHPARLVPEKGAKLSIRMLERLRATGVDASLTLTDGVIVDWKDEATGFRREIDELIDGLGLREHVSIRTVPCGRMAELYAEADVVVYPSSYPEPLGLVPLEAMAAGRPVIVTRIGGLPETVRDGVTGFVIEPGDLDAMERIVRHLLRDPGLRCELGSAGRARVRTHFDLEAYVDWMVRAYRAVTVRGPV